MDNGEDIGGLMFAHHQMLEELDNTVIEAVDYKHDYPNDVRGKDMVGNPCPTCGSKLVVRTRRKDETKFIACDKSKRPRCPFTIGVEETMLGRTTRVRENIEGKMYSSIFGEDF